MGSKQKKRRGVPRTTVESPLHPNIVKPTIKFCDLEDEQQALITALAKTLAEQIPAGMPEEEQLKATIELFEKGILRIVSIEETQEFSFQLFDFDKGEYIPIKPPTKH